MENSDKFINGTHIGFYDTCYLDKKLLPSHEVNSFNPWLTCYTTKTETNVHETFTVDVRNTSQGDIKETKPIISFKNIEKACEDKFKLFYQGLEDFIQKDVDEGLTREKQNELIQQKYSSWGYEVSINNDYVYVKDNYVGETFEVEVFYEIVVKTSLENSSYNINLYIDRNLEDYIKTPSDESWYDYYSFSKNKNEEIKTDLRVVQNIDFDFDKFKNTPSSLDKLNDRIELLKRAKYELTSAERVNIRIVSSRVCDIIEENTDLSFSKIMSILQDYLGYYFDVKTSCNTLVFRNSNPTHLYYSLKLESRAWFVSATLKVYTENEVPYIIWSSEAPYVFEDSFEISITKAIEEETDEVLFAKTLIEKINNWQIKDSKTEEDKPSEYLKAITNYKPLSIPYDSFDTLENSASQINSDLQDSITKLSDVPGGKALEYSSDKKVQLKNRIERPFNEEIQEVAKNISGTCSKCSGIINMSGLDGCYCA